MTLLLHDDDLRLHWLLRLLLRNIYRDVSLPFYCMTVAHIYNTASVIHMSSDPFLLHIVAAEIAISEWITGYSIPAGSTSCALLIRAMARVRGC
ncbi:MAG TPA: hypothetical protein VF818_07895 [Ktedonobacterales bacterium]